MNCLSPHLTKRSIAAVATALAITLVACALLVTGCASGPPEDPPGIVGAITNVSSGDESGARSTVILVESPAPDASFVSDKASVSVSAETPVYDAAGDKTDRAALLAGVEVRVWFAGAVAESYPVQGQAAAVQLTGR